FLAGAGREPGLAHRIDKYGAFLRSPTLTQRKGFYVEDSREPGNAAGGKGFGLTEPVECREAASRHHIAIWIPLLFRFAFLIPQYVFVPCDHEQGIPEAVDGRYRIVRIQSHRPVDGVGSSLSFSKTVGPTRIDFQYIETVRVETQRFV